MECEDEFARVLFAELVGCFFGLAFVELAVFDFAVVDFAVAGFLVADFAVFALVPPLVFESEADACPSAVEAQAHINARTQPAPSHLRIFARCFPLGSKGNLRRSVASVQ